MGVESSVVLGAEQRITSLADGTCNSRRIMAFGTYHGISAIKHRAFD
jgi:hypothetical protein